MFFLLLSIYNLNQSYQFFYILILKSTEFNEILYQKSYVITKLIIKSIINIYKNSIEIISQPAKNINYIFSY